MGAQIGGTHLWGIHVREDGRLSEPIKKSYKSILKAKQCNFKRRGKLNGHIISENRKAN